MNIFDFIKSQIAILDIVQEYTTLKRAGGYWKGLCPFHSEKTGSFTVSPSREIFYCFGCQASGDVISFIAKIENFSPIEAAKFLVEHNGLQLPEYIQKEHQQSAGQTGEKERHFKLCEVVTRWCQQNLTQTKSAQDYLNSRQINTQSIKDFNIGYFPKGLPAIQSLIKFVQDHGILASDLIDVNIVQRNNDRLFSGFEDRIIFPITDHLGRFCAFGGRVFRAGDDRVKYYNSHEHHYFNKRATLYGLNLAKKAIQASHSVFLVEGYTDCIAMHQAGFANAVATLGTACTSEHIDIIARLANQLQILYDSDQAGLNAVEKLASLCWNANLDIRVIELPKEQDPASYLQDDLASASNEIANNKLAFKKLITNSKDIYQFVISKTSSQFTGQNLSKKVNASHKIIDMINKVTDPIKRNILLQDAAQVLGINTDLLNFTKTHNPDSQNPEFNNFDLNTPLDKIEYNSLEIQLFTIFINNPTLFVPKYHYLASYLDTPAKEILQKLILLQNQLAIDQLVLADLMAILDENEQGFVRKSLLTYNDKMANGIEQILAQFHKKHWKTIVGHIKNLLVQEKSDPDKVRQIIKNFQVLKSEIVDGGK